MEHHSKEAKALSEPKSVVVVGLGEVGRPLLELVSEHHNAVGVDITPPTGEIGKVDVLHVCYPFDIKDFVGETARYIELFRPTLTIINSTVAIGTTRAVAERTGAAVVHSPVRGKHARMLEEMRVTTYFGLMIAWAQEVERYCDQSDQQYDEIVSFWEEIKFFPSVKYFPGIIGGHCVMPNIGLLNKFNHSVILEAIHDSNEKKIERDARTKLSNHSMTDKRMAVGSRS